MNGSITLEFRKSSFSAENGQECVEIAGTLGAVRDSKNPAGPLLHTDLTALLTNIKSGRFIR